MLWHDCEGEVIAGAASIARLEKVVPPVLVKVEPLARFPVIADDEVLLMTVKTVPAMSVPVLRSAKTNCAALLIITPLPATCVALRVVRSKAHL